MIRRLSRHTSVARTSGPLSSCAVRRLVGRKPLPNDQLPRKTQDRLDFLAASDVGRSASLAKGGCGCAQQFLQKRYWQTIQGRTVKHCANAERFCYN